MGEVHAEHYRADITSLYYVALLVEKELGDHMKLKRTKYISCNKPIWSYHEPALGTDIHQLTLKPFVVSVLSIL